MLNSAAFFSFTTSDFARSITPNGNKLYMFACKLR